MDKICWLISNMPSFDGSYAFDYKIIYYIISFCSKLKTGLCLEKKIISKIKNFCLLISSLRIVRRLVFIWFWFGYFSLA